MRLSSLGIAKGVVVRLGGNALFERQSERPRTDVVEAAVELAASAYEEGIRTVILPGGIGGQVLIEWGRELRASEAVLGEVGRALINASAGILADYVSAGLTARKVPCSPVPALNRRDLTLGLEMSATVVSGCCLEGGITSDSLAVLIAEMLDFDVLSVKRTLPFKNLRTPIVASQGEQYWVAVPDLLRELAQTPTSERAGWHPSVDIWALRLLLRSSVRMFITTSDGFVASSTVDALNPYLLLSR